MFLRRLGGRVELDGGFKGVFRSIGADFLLQPPRQSWLILPKDAMSDAVSRCWPTYIPPDSLIFDG